MNLAGVWDQLVDAVCRPPRDNEYTEADLVGGRRASFRLYDRRYYREDITLRNSREQKLQGSHYRPCVVTSADGRLPCVVYCHCNSGSRRDAEEVLFHLLPKGFTVFAFDFAGSGLSDGSYVTLGALEVDDLAAVVQYLRDEGSTSTIGLWGRSMGAVTALLYSQRDPTIAGMVLDSPFSRLVDLMMELAVDQQLRIPKPLLKVALAMLKRSVKKRAGFSVDAVAPLHCVGGSYIPALFGHASDDTFVHKHHSERLFHAYAGDKNFVSFEGDHNSVRPDFFYDSALIFLIQALRVEELVGPALDLQAVPQGSLPHLCERQNSIYVAATRNPSAAASDVAAASAELQPSDVGKRSPSHEGETESSSVTREPTGGSTDSGTGSDTASPISRTMSRQLSPPWSMDVLPRGRAGRRPPPSAADPEPQARTAQQQQQQEQRQRRQGRPRDGTEGGTVHYLTEEQALQLALEASLLDARQTKGAGVHGWPHSENGALVQPVAGGRNSGLPFPRLLSDDQQQGRGPVPAGGGEQRADLPGSVDEERAMLAAAIAASLAQQPSSPEAAAAACGPAAAQAPLAPAASPLASAAAAVVGSLAIHDQRSPAAAGAAKRHVDQRLSCAGVVGSTQEALRQQRQQQQHHGLGPTPAGPAGPARMPTLHHTAEQHAASEAAAVRQPAEQLQRVLSGAADGSLPEGLNQR